MLNPSVPSVAIDETGRNARPAAPQHEPRAARGVAAEPLVLCWIFPVGSQPPHLLTAHAVIGRASDCDVCLEGRAISRHHAEIRHGASQTLLSDLHSTNGLFLNGVRVTHASVTEGDVVRLGNWVGCFAATGAPDPGRIAQLGPELWGGDTFARLLETLQASHSPTLPVTLIGESGTGKRRIARTLHTWAGRRGPFNTLNCATLSQRQVEAVLFGPRTRSGTAPRVQQGLAHASQGGTLLLEEAGELSPMLQGRLCRVLGLDRSSPSAASTPLDVHLVITRQHPRSGTQGPLAQALTAHGAPKIELPPLRQRVLELPALFSHFLNLYATGELFAVDAELIEALCLYTWPGNVRELEFLARQLVTLHQGAREVQRQHLPRRILDAVKLRGQTRDAREHETLDLADTARLPIAVD